MNNKVKAAIGAAALAAMAATTVGIAAPAQADIPANCENLYWPDLLHWGQNRAICDAPISEEGSWQRHRVLWTPAHQVPLTTHCYGYRYVTCYSTGGYWVDETVNEDMTYMVFPNNVLPNEPGHLG